MPKSMQLALDDCMRLKGIAMNDKRTVGLRETQIKPFRQMARAEFPIHLWQQNVQDLRVANDAKPEMPSTLRYSSIALLPVKIWDFYLSHQKCINHSELSGQMIVCAGTGFGLEEGWIMTINRCCIIDAELHQELYLDGWISPSVKPPWLMHY